MKRSTTLTPAFIKKIKKAHTTTTRFNWRVIGTSGKTNHALRFVLHNVPHLLNDWARMYKNSNKATSFKKLNGKKNARNTKHNWNGSKLNTRNKRTSSARWTSKNGTWHNTNAKHNTSAKRNTRTKSGRRTRTTTTRRFNGTTFGKRTSFNNRTKRGTRTNNSTYAKRSTFNAKRSNGTSLRTRSKRFSTYAKNRTNNRFNTNAKRANKFHFTTNAKRYTATKRNYRARRAA